MKELVKFCSVRVSENIHKKAKIQAIQEGLTLQQWILKLIEERLSFIKKDS